VKTIPKDIELNRQLKQARGKRAKPPRAASGALPSRDELLAFIGGEKYPEGAKIPARIGKREIARAFGVRGDAKSDLKVMLKELTSEGAIARGGKTFNRPGRLPTTLVAEVVAKNRDGEMIARPVEWSGAGAAPRIRLKRSRSKAETGRPPALGARVLLKIALDPDASPGAPAYGGRLVKIIERPKVRVLGVYRRLADGGGRVAPVEKRAREEFFVPAGFENGAREGDLVALETISESRFGPANARIVEKLGSLRSESAISLIAINAHQIPHIFPAAALAEAEAEAARPAGMRHREDWRRLPLVTIDPADAKDHDDAVYAAPDPDPANPGGFILTVAIADVAHYVRPGSALDKEALERGNSVYFPGRVVPMLPERISNDLCSLRPSEDRPALAVRMTIDRQGRKLRHKFHRIMMRSAAKLSYEQAQAAIDGAPDNDTTPIVETVIKPLYRAYEAIRIERSKRNPLDLDLPERKLILNADGSLERVIWPERLGAHRLIEEFMILANVAAAESLEEAKVSLIYRAHDAPSLEKLEDLNQFLATLGVKFARGERLRPAQFNGVLAHVKGEPHEALVNEVVLRSQSQAEYAHENYGHFGLNLRRYAHFTSPIRRYADLVVHRALIRALNLGEGGAPDIPPNELAAVAERISAAERRAMAAERETTDRLIAAFMSEHIGATFKARVAGVTRVGLFVRLAETGADGFVPAASLGGEYFRFNEGARALVGAQSGETFRLGDDVLVKLVEAAPFAGALRFEMASEGVGKRRARKGRRR
jgi:ribonuclease R